MADAWLRMMLFLVFGHTAEEPPLRIGPLADFRIAGALIQDGAGTVIARHNGARWVAEGRVFYRMDCEGPLTVKLEGGAAGEDAAPGAAPGARALGPFEHFSLFNGTAYASRDLFAHYHEQADAWLLHGSGERYAAILVEGVSEIS